MDSNILVNKRTEGLVTGAAKGALIGSVVPFVGTVTGAAVGAAVGTVLPPTEIMKEKTIFNREMLVTGAVLAATGVFTGGLLPAAAALGATFVAGKIGEKRMESEYKEASVQIAKEQIQAAQAVQAGTTIDQTLANQQQRYMNVVSQREIDAAKANGPIAGGFAERVRNQQQQQELAMAGAAR